MVSKTKDGFICDDCKLAYKEKMWAQKCEEWCLAHRTCNIAITNHAIMNV